MKAVVFRGVGDIRLENVPDPSIKDPFDAVIRLTASAICGTDLHMIRGTLPGMVPGTILGHEGVGIIEEVGKQVRNFKKGDRVVIPSTVGCGYCSYCRSGYFAQCDNANPHGHQAGTCFFGGPKTSGPLHGMQAEYVRVPYSNVGLVKIPDGISDDKAIFLSDIFPTGYFGALLAEVKSGDTVAVFGCGPVGQFAIVSAFLLGAGRVFAIDRIDSRLEMAQNSGAEIINFEREDPVEAIRKLTGQIGVDRAIDAVGIDAVMPHQGPASSSSKKLKHRFQKELKSIAPKVNPDGQKWMPGDAPSLSLLWCVQSLAKAGTLSIIGVYPETMNSFPIGLAMNKNLTVNMGNCNHRKYIPELMELIKEDVLDPEKILTHIEPLTSALDAYEAFDERQAGWVKVELIPTR
jgi:threonine dehydrogenase-like Zn-dependent dehydrogenase